jgi:hypothetical protein
MAALPLLGKKALTDVLARMPAARLTELLAVLSTSVTVHLMHMMEVLNAPAINDSVPVTALVKFMQLMCAFWGRPVLAL